MPSAWPGYASRVRYIGLWAYTVRLFIWFVMYVLVYGKKMDRKKWMEMDIQMERETERDRKRKK